MVIGSRLGRWVADLAIALLALFFVFAVVRRYFPQAGPSRVQTAELRPHEKVRLSGVAWGNATMTVLLGLSTECPYCEASLPFYRSLTQFKFAENGRPRFVAVFPQSATEGSEYLRQAKVSADQVLHGNLPTMGILATPTLAVVDKTGTVSNLWVGRMSDSQQKDLWAVLEGRKPQDADSAFAPAVVDDKEVGLLEAAGTGVTVIDVGRRADYAPAGPLTEVNIPVDELATRARVEIPSHNTVVVDCQRVPLFYCDVAAKALHRTGFRDVDIWRVPGPASN